MGEVVPFPKKLAHSDLTKEQYARYLAMLADGFTCDAALAVLRQTARVRGVCHGD